MNTKQTIYYEEQKIPTLYRALMSLLIIATDGYVIFKVASSGNIKTSAIFAAASILLLGCIIYTKFIISIDRNSINIRFYPFMLKNKELPIKDLERYYTRKYRPLMEYGGWGIRWNSNGRAYCIRGKMAVQLEFKSGSKILIGTQKPDELKAAIDCIYQSQL